MERTLVSFCNNFDMARIFGETFRTRPTGSSLNYIKLSFRNNFDQKIWIVERKISKSFNPNDIAGGKIVFNLGCDNNLITILSKILQDYSNIWKIHLFLEKTLY